MRGGRKGEEIMGLAPCFQTHMGVLLVGIDVTHWDPDVLDLSGMVEELLASRLSIRRPVTLPIVHPGPLDTVG